MAFIVWASRPISSSVSGSGHPPVDRGAADGRHLGPDRLDRPQGPSDQVPRHRGHGRHQQRAADPQRLADRLEVLLELVDRGRGVDRELARGRVDRAAEALRLEAEHAVRRDQGRASGQGLLVGGVGLRREGAGVLRVGRRRRRAGGLRRAGRGAGPDLGVGRGRCALTDHGQVRALDPDPQVRARPGRQHGPDRQRVAVLVDDLDERRHAGEDVGLGGGRAGGGHDRVERRRAVLAAAPRPGRACPRRRCAPVPSVCPRPTARAATPRRSPPPRWPPPRRASAAPAPSAAPGARPHGTGSQPPATTR